MATPVNRLKGLVRQKDIRSYRELRRYVNRYCGHTLNLALRQYEKQLELYIDARVVAREHFSIYKKPSHYQRVRLKAKR